MTSGLRVAASERAGLGCQRAKRRRRRGVSARLGCWAGPKEREDEQANEKGERDGEE